MDTASYADYGVGQKPAHRIVGLEPGHDPSAAVKPHDVGRRAPGLVYPRRDRDVTHVDLDVGHARYGRPGADRSDRLVHLRARVRQTQRVQGRRL
jgi:hypothetical protein